MKQKENVMINFCRQQATLSKCKDAKVAAVLVSADMTQIYSIGINGGPKNGQQCLCLEDSKSKYSCVHAEQNCLVKNTTIDQIPKILICTKQPCTVCASLIVNCQTNVQEVWYIDEYWDKRGLLILQDARILPKRLKEIKRGVWSI